MAQAPSQQDNKVANDESKELDPNVKHFKWRDALHTKIQYINSKLESGNNGDYLFKLFKDLSEEKKQFYQNLTKKEEILNVLTTIMLAHKSALTESSGIINEGINFYENEDKQLTIEIRKLQIEIGHLEDEFDTASKIKKLKIENEILKKKLKLEKHKLENEQLSNTHKSRYYEFFDNINDRMMLYLDELGFNWDVIDSIFKKEEENKTRERQKKYEKDTAKRYGLDFDVNMNEINNSDDKPAISDDNMENAD